MKYLKLFENISVDGYESITKGNMFNLGRLENLENFNNSLLRIVSESLKNYNKKLNIALVKSNDITRIAANDLNHEARITIFELKDEWYLLNLYIYELHNGGYMSEYYKFDQLSGLISCIENLPK